MLRVFPITPTRAAKLDSGRLLRNNQTWDLLKPAFIQRHWKQFKLWPRISQKWHDGSTSRKVSNGSSDGIAAIANILDSLERDMKKLKENVHVIQVGCESCGGAHLDKECPLLENIKSIE
ncbi:hypothetical protein Tco_0046866 [Tanacetum coccineum]